MTKKLPVLLACSHCNQCVCDWCLCQCYSIQYGQKSPDMSSGVLSLLMIKAKTAAVASMSESGYPPSSDRAKQATFCQKSWWS